MIKAIVVYFTLISTLPLAMARAHVGVMIYYWYTLMVPQHTATIVQFGWAKLIVAVALIGWIANRSFRHISWHPILYLHLLFALWMMITTVFARYQGTAVDAMVDQLKFTLMFVLATSVATNRVRVHGFMWVMLLGVGFWAAFGGLKVLAGAGGFTVDGPPNSQYSDTNHFALWMLQILPWAAYMVLHSAHRYVRFAMIGLILATLLSIVGTDSRGAFLGIGMMGIAFLFFSRRKALVIGLGIVLIGAFLIVVPSERLDRYTARVDTIKTYEEDGSANERLNAWNFAIRRANQTFPLAAGTGAFQDNMTRRQREFLEKHGFIGSTGRGRVAHSIYFHVLGEQGWIGLTIYIAWLLMIVQRSLSIYRRCRNDPEMFWARDFGFAALLSTIGFMSAGAFLSVHDSELILLIGALVIGVDVQVRAREAEARKALTPRQGYQGAAPVRGEGTAD